MPAPAACDALIEAVRAVARAEILPRFRALDAAHIDTKTGPNDLVTMADRAAEAALAARIETILPGAAIVGEEAAEGDPAVLTPLAGDGTVAVIDPIDGTWNFAHDLACFGVILAVQEAGETTFGLLYDPVLDDWVSARRGEGAVFGRPGAAARSLRTVGDRPRARETGYLGLPHFDTADQPMLAAMTPLYGRVQSLRCSAQEYRMLARGHADWSVSALSKPWDHMAGRLIVTEAGGAWDTLGGGYDPLRSDQVVLAASSPDRLEALRDEIGAALS